MSDSSGAGKPRVGYIGLGLMGKPMARNLLKAGFPLAVYNRTHARTEDLAAEGATVAGSPRELAAQVDVLCSCVTGPADVEAVYLGSDGVVAGVRAGALLIEMSTIDPETHRRIAARAAERGAAYLDAPVSGGVGGARDGTLTIMVGGDAAAVERARPVLEAMGSRIYHVGPTGSGAIVKLVNNMVVAVNAMAAAEGMLLGVKAGIDPTLLHDILVNASAQSRALAGLKDSTLVGNFEPGFTVDNMEKDVTLATLLGRQEKVPLPGASLAGQYLRAAQAMGLGGKSTAAQIIPLEQLCGVEVRGKRADA
jgi:3-hydroxyisobutyrate dehydrogenase-like beta-hydroxyacid dehydrogenase